MRVVLDTNVIVSGLIWGGPPRHLLDLACQNTITLYTSAVLLDELAGVLSREKFAAHLAARGLTPNGIMRGYAALARTVAAPVIARTGSVTEMLVQYFKIYLNQLVKEVQQHFYNTTEIL